MTEPSSAESGQPESGQSEPVLACATCPWCQILADVSARDPQAAEALLAVGRQAVELIDTWEDQVRERMVASVIAMWSGDIREPQTPTGAGFQTPPKSRFPAGTEASAQMDDILQPRNRPEPIRIALSDGRTRAHRVT